MRKLTFFLAATLLSVNAYAAPKSSSTGAMCTVTSAKSAAVLTKASKYPVQKMGVMPERYYPCPSFNPDSTNGPTAIPMAVQLNAVSGINVTTRAFNNQRTGANLQETVFTPALIQSKGLRVLFTVTMPDDARGTEGQPLIVSGLTMNDGLVHNVLYSATMADDVFAFDATNGKQLWEQHIGNPIPDTQGMDMWGTQNNWGVLSTPVIDVATNTLYVVDMTSPTGMENNSLFYLHGLSLTTGVDIMTPVPLNGAQYPASGGPGAITLGKVPRKQRPALLLSKLGDRTTIFIAFGSFVESASTNHGFVVAVDTTDTKNPYVAGAITTTFKYSGGGIWMAGQGLAMDAATGNICGVTGNGAFDGKTEFSNSLFCLSYKYPNSVAGPGTFAFAQWFSPFNDVGRVGYTDQTLVDLSLIPPGGYSNDPGGPNNMDPPSDEDLGSAGLLALPTTLTSYAKNVTMAAGKDGILYITDSANMGNNHNTDFAANLIQQNVYHKLLFPPYGFTFYPGGMNLAPTVLSQLQTTQGGYSHHQHSTPVYYNSPVLGSELFTGGENGPVRAFTFNKDYSVTYLAAGTDNASANMPPPGGMPGSMLSISANGSVPDTCVLWATQPVGNANRTVTPGYLLAYSCDTFNNKQLVKLYDSRTSGLTFMFNKFDVVTPANGILYLPTYDGRIIALGLNP
jgi:hypothetical protein